MLDMQRYALPFSVVERVVNAVEVTPLPDAPDIVCGIVNVEGKLIPVVNMRRRFHFPERETGLGDQLVLARAGRRSVAFFVDSVSAVADYPSSNVVAAEAIMEGMGCINGVVKTADGVILIHDLARLLSLDDEQALDRALAPAQPA